MSVRSVNMKNDGSDAGTVLLKEGEGEGVNFESMVGIVRDRRDILG